MTLLIFILMAFSVSALTFLIWIYNDYRKYKKQNNLIIILLLLFPTSLSAQYTDGGCRISFKWHDNQAGKLEQNKDGLTYRFIPGSTHWKITIKNNASEEARINWTNAQLIINGQVSGIYWETHTPETSSPSIIKSQSELSQTIAIAPSSTSKANLKLYDKKSIGKGNKAAVTIILPVSVGNQPQFFNTFDFIVTQVHQ